MNRRRPHGPGSRWAWGCLVVLAALTALGSNLGSISANDGTHGAAAEDISANYGPCYDRRSLIAGRTDSTWKVPTTWSWGPEQWVKYPWGAVFSFYERNAALVGAVMVVLSDNVLFAPRAAEIWASMDPDPKQYASSARTLRKDSAT